jgi:hypothetical protein
VAAVLDSILGSLILQEVGCLAELALQVQYPPPPRYVMSVTRRKVRN